MPQPPSVACWVIRLLLTPLRKEASSSEIELSNIFNEWYFEKEKEIAKNQHLANNRGANNPQENPSEGPVILINLD